MKDGKSHNDDVLLGEVVLLSLPRKPAREEDGLGGLTTPAARSVSRVMLILLPFRLRRPLLWNNDLVALSGWSTLEVLGLEGVAGRDRDAIERSGVWDDPALESTDAPLRC